jgi:hypothetical protein
MVFHGCPDIGQNALCQRILIFKTGVDLQPAESLGTELGALEFRRQLLEARTMRRERALLPT